MRAGTNDAFRWLLVGLSLLVPTIAHAQICNFSVSNINFGSLDTLSGTINDTTATTSISCNGLSLFTIRLCPNLGSGTGGLTESNRRLLSGANTLNYQLYSNTWGGTVWGSDLFADPPTPPPLTLTLNVLGTGSLAPTIFARAFGGQSAASPGSYVSTFSGTE